MKIYAVNIAENFDDSLFKKLLEYVSGEKQNRIKRLARPMDAKGMLMGEVLVRLAVYKETGMREIEFDKNNFGKPFLKDMDNLHFNISHSGDWTVCAVDSLPVGIDIEKIKPVDLDIARRFFSEEECKELLSKGSDKILSYFFELWTLKESYIKAVGEGLSMPLDSFTINTDDDITISSDGRKLDWHFRMYEADRDYKMSVCAKHIEFPIDCKVLSPQEIFYELEDMKK